MQIYIQWYFIMSPSQRVDRI